MSKRTLLNLASVFFLVGVVVVLGYLFHVGLFSSIQVEDRKMRPLFLVYRAQLGEYKQTVGTVGELVRQMQTVGIQDIKGFAIYYDDPAKVEADKRRSEAGVILNDTDKARAAGVISRYQSRVFPSMEGAAATFPLRNSLSVMLGAWRVYPRLNDYLEANSHTAAAFSLEIYDFGNQITFFLPYGEQKL